MRILLSAIVLFFASFNTSSALEFKWPDYDTSIPPEVYDFIVSECNKYKGSTEENLQDCIRGELYGYQAVVSMLTDGNTGEKSAERYRACRAGLGDFGGRFHRRRAECIGYSFRYVWRFEFTRRASISNGHSIVETAFHSRW